MASKYSDFPGDPGDTRARFCSGCKEHPSTMEMLRQAARDLPTAEDSIGTVRSRRGVIA